MEKNDLVRVIAHQTSVFRGDEWPHLSVDIKIGKALLLSSQYAIGTHYFLSARLEKVGGKSDLLQLAMKSEGIKMAFDRGSFVGNDKSKCRIMDDPWNRLTCQLKTCLFESGENIRVLVYCVKKTSKAAMNLYSMVFLKSSHQKICTHLQLESQTAKRIK